MEAFGYLLLGTLIDTVILLVVVSIAARLVDISLPGFVETLWKLAALNLLSNTLFMMFEPASGALALLASGVVFWGGMVKWFEIDFFAAIVIVALSMCLRHYVITVVLMSFAQWGGE